MAAPAQPLPQAAPTADSSTTSGRHSAAESTDSIDSNSFSSMQQRIEGIHRRLNAPDDQSQEIDPRTAREAMQDLRFLIEDEKQLLKEFYPRLSDSEIQEIALLELENKKAEAEKLRKEGVKRELEMAAKEQEEDDKDLHTEGTGSGKSIDMNKPVTNMDAAERRAFARFQK